MSSRTYATLTDGQWERPVMRGYRLVCCTCGATHCLNFRIVRGQVEFQSFRVRGAVVRSRKRKTRTR